MTAVAASLEPRIAEPQSGANGRALSIAMVVTQATWGGGEEQARLLAVGLRERGHTCQILARRDGEFAERMTAAGFHVSTFTGRGQSPGAIWHMRRTLHQWRPDVLHMNDPRAVTAAGIASQGLGLAARVAARHHTFRVRWPLKYRLFAQRVVCDCRDVARACAESGVPKSILVPVHSGVDPEVMMAGDRARGRAALGAAPDQFVLFTAARLLEVKGHCYLLDALPQIIAQHPNTLVAFAGEGPLAGELRAHVERLGLERHVRFLGFRRDVPDLVKGCDLFVMPTLAEGVCTVLMEVLFVGAPIVTTNVNGIPEVVGDASTPGGPVAWVVPPREPEALADAILTAMAAPEQAAENARRGRARALGMFTVNHMVEATLAVYREALAENAKKAAAA